MSKTLEQYKSGTLEVVWDCAAVFPWQGTSLPVRWSLSAKGLWDWPLCDSGSSDLRVPRTIAEFTHTLLAARPAAQCSQGPSGTSNTVIRLASYSWRTSSWMQPSLLPKYPHSKGFPSRRLQLFQPNHSLLVRCLFTRDYSIFIMT